MNTSNDSERRVPTQWHCAHVLEGVHERTIRGVAYSPSGKSIATASFDASTAIWEQANSDEGKYPIQCNDSYPLIVNYV
jgi:WD40 repeat protein